MGLFERFRSPAPPPPPLLLAGGEDAEARGIEIEVDRFFKVGIPHSLKKGQSLVWDGSDKAILYNDKGQLLERIALGRTVPSLAKGSHTVTIEAGLAGSGDPVLRGAIKLKTTAESVGGR